MWRKGCRAATQRVARQPIGSSSTSSARAVTVYSGMLAGDGLKKHAHGLSFSFTSGRECRLTLLPVVIGAGVVVALAIGWRGG